MREQHGVAPHHVDTGGHHGRRVNQRRHRRRPFHRVGQPDVQRNLRRLTGGTDEQQQANQRQHAELPELDRQRRSRVGDSAEVERAEGVINEEHAEDESPVTHAVDDERLLAGIRRALLLVPVADQQIGAEAHAFPADEHREESTAKDEREHEETEEVQVAEEPRVAPTRLVVHVGRRVDMNERSDAGDDEQHHRRKRIEPECPRDLEPPNAVRGGERNRRNPVTEVHHVLARIGRKSEQLPEGIQREAERTHHRGARHERRRVLLERANADEPVNRGAECRQKRYQPNQIHLYLITNASRSFRRC